MPKITGTIPLEGNIKTAVKCGSNVILSLYLYDKHVSLTYFIDLYGVYKQHHVKWYETIKIIIHTRVDKSFKQADAGNLPGRSRFGNYAGFSPKSRKLLIYSCTAFRSKVLIHFWQKYSNISKEKMFVFSKSGVSILQWFFMGNEIDPSADYALYISFAADPLLGWSCPVRVDKHFLRRSVVVLSENGCVS